MYRRLYTEFQIIINIVDYSSLTGIIHLFIWMDCVESQIRIFEWQCAYLYTKRFTKDLEDFILNTV